jgi:hypothetical protein
VAVEGHRLEPELLPQTTHRHRLDAGTVGEIERRVEDAVSAEGCPCFRRHA